MKTVIITQDLTPISSLTGFWGNLYYQLVRLTQQFNLWLIRFFYPKAIVPSWDGLLSKNNLKKERKLSWQIVEENIAPNFKHINYQNIQFIKAWETYLAIYLSHQILSYHQAIKRFFQKKPQQVIILGSSSQEQITKLIAKGKNIKIIHWPCINFSRLNRLLLDWFYYRQLTIKANHFLKVNTKALKAKQKSILLAASFFRHLKTLLPLHNKLIKKNHPSLIIHDSLESPPRHSLHLASILSLKQKSHLYQQQIKKGKTSWQKIKHSFYNHPKTIQELSTNLLKGYLKTLTLRAFPLSCLYLASSEALINQTKPKAIILISDVRPLEVSLGLMAQKHNIKSLLISPNTILSPDAINKYLLTDQITVVGSHIKKELVSLGLNPNKIHQVGDLRFDSITKKKLSSLRKKTLKKLKLSLNAKLFLLVSFRANPRIPLKEKKAFFQIASQAIASIPKAKLIIKPHPTESQTNLKNQVKKWGIKALITDNRQLELIDILSVCQATLLTWSMTGFESLLSQTPVVVINPTQKNYDDIIPYVKLKGAQLAKSSNQLKSILLKLISSKKNMDLWIKNGLNFVKRYINPPDGQTAEKIINLILS